jgi:hypothetical protein
MPPPSDPRNLRAKWQRALEERRKAAAAAPPPLDVTKAKRDEAGGEQAAATRAEAKAERAAAMRADAASERASATSKHASATRADAASERASATSKHASATRADAASERPGATRAEAATERAASMRADAASERATARGDAANEAASATRPGTARERAAANRAEAAIERAAATRAEAAGEGPTGLRVEAASEDAVASKKGGGASKKLGGAPKDDGDEAAKKAATAASSPWSSVVAALVLVGGVGFALRTFLGPDGSSAPDDGTGTSSTTTATMEPELPLEPERAPVKSRCAEMSKQPFVIGDAPAPKPASTSTDMEDPPEDELAPFAVELGRGVAFGAGFAVGTQRQAEGGTVSMVATLGPDADDGKLVRLARSRGDFDPPVVAAAGSSLLAAMMEPNAGGRAIRIAKVEGDRVTWGPELAEGRDESLALDLAATGTRAIVVWDDVPAGRERSVIDLATFDVATMHGSGGRAITPPTIDADQPRLAPRPGGYWLSYVVHGDAPTEPTAAKDDAPTDTGTNANANASAKKKPGTKGDTNPDDSDTEAAGEAIAHQWLELIPLDENGMATGAPRAVTPKDGRVIGYDLEDDADGRAVLLYREDDTPNGSNGGRVKVITVELGGVGEPHVIAEEGVGAGVPQLFSSWVVIHSMSGPVQIGAIGPHGELTAELAPEKPLGHGEVIAASGNAFLIATPAGRAMKLAVARCAR